MIRTNAHTHLVSADHMPPASLYYMLRNALHEMLFNKVPALGNTPRGIDGVLDGLTFTPATGLWVDAFQLLAKDLNVKRIVKLFETCSRLSETEASEAFGAGPGSDGKLMIENLVNRTAELHRTTSDTTPFRTALAEIVVRLFDAHRAKCVDKGPVTSKEMWHEYLSIAGARDYERLIVLSLDLDKAFDAQSLPVRNNKFWSTPTVGFDDQAAELAQLAEEVSDELPYIVPFFGVDPDGYGASRLLKRVKRYVGRDKTFKGIKLYPPMGFKPDNRSLQDVYHYCQDNGIPVLAHCSQFGAGVKSSTKNYADYASPNEWRPVLKKLKKRQNKKGVFRLCLAHFDDLTVKRPRHGWYDEIVELMKDFDGSKGVKVYTDIAADVVPETGKPRRRYYKRAWNVRNQGLGNRVIFGSDWWHNVHRFSSETEFRNQLIVWSNDEHNQACQDYLSDVEDD